MSQKAFRERIRGAIANPDLQSALDNNAFRRMNGRVAAFASLPDHMQRRQQAHAIKSAVVSRLDETLRQFISKVEANGITVHRAENAASALEIFLDIARSVEAKRKPFADPDSPLLIAKSKSMLSEEIGLNHALEAAGMRVVETDLGEYIVQLRGERPSHIITPAVHLRRAEVGRLFEEKLGLPYTEDIPTLTNTARRVLRQVFLEADLGVSGVNFGVASTGTLAIVTNEGNGRMVTSLPGVHVALMGIERLVPTLDDLALFLSLLPRSATGQKLSVYTSLIHAPLPTQTRHLILVDNGRSALLGSPLEEALYCIRCGACLNACPVFREIGGHAYDSIYPGPIGSVISCALVDPGFDLLAQASSLCGACRAACPVDIDLPGLLLRVRAGLSPDGSTGGKPLEGAGLPVLMRLGMRGYRLVAVRERLFAAIQRAGSLFSRLFSPLREYMHLPAFTGWGLSKDFPRFAARPFRARFAGIPQAVQEVCPAQPVPPGEAEPLSTTKEKSPVVQFCEEFKLLGGQVHTLTDQELTGRLKEFMETRGFERALVDETIAPILSPAAACLDADPAIRVGITGVLAGIADTGSLLMEAGAASLLPEVHLAVLRSSQLVPDLQQALRLKEVRVSRSAVIITGPSRTADIEMTLTIGVHGPGELHLFLIDDSIPV